jgi:hypothetical protein
MDGFQCNVTSCIGFLSISRNYIRTHINKVHKLEGEKCTQAYSKVSLQSWYTQHRDIAYWTVSHLIPERQCLIGERQANRWRSASEHHHQDLDLDNLMDPEPSQVAPRNPELDQEPCWEDPELEAMLDEIEQDEQDRLALMELDFIVEDNVIKEGPNTTIWLKRTGWHTLFANRPLDIIVASRLLPRQPTRNAPTIQQRLLGAWAGEPIHSVAESEIKLWIISRCLDKAFDIYKETLENTNLTHRC